MSRQRLRSSGPPYSHETGLLSTLRWLERSAGSRPGRAFSGPKQRRSRGQHAAPGRDKSLRRDSAGIRVLGVFSSEVDTGSREENASNKGIEPPFRFNRDGKGSSLLKWLNSLYRPALPEGIRGKARAAAFQTALGRRQVVRQWILIPPCGGSNPPAPARHSRGRTCHPSKGRKARCWRPFAIRRRSLNSQIGKLACHFGKSLRPKSAKTPVFGRQRPETWFDRDCHPRPHEHGAVVFDTYSANLSKGNCFVD